MKKKFFVLFFTFLTLSTFIFADAAKEKRDKFISCAKNYLGVKYSYGGTSTAGFDCSGFVYTAAKDAGFSLPRNSAAMYQSATKISDSDRQPGDLLFFAVGSSISHVGIYLGNGQMIHCASDGPKTGVIISKLSENYWKTHYYCAGRVISAVASEPEKTPATPNPTTSKPSSTTSKPSSSSNNKKKNSLDKANMFFTYGGYFDWSLYKPTNEFGFWPKGGTLQAELQTHIWSINPGIMVRYTYPFTASSMNEFNPMSLFNNFNMPVCLSIHLNDYVAVYSGVVLSTGKVCPQPQLLVGTEKYIEPLIYPGIFGVTFQTPRFKLGSTYFSIMQDVSFTCYKASEGYEPLTFKEAFAAGTTFSTGINITLPF